VIAEYITDFSIIIVLAVLVFWLIIKNSNLKPSRIWSILALILDHWNTTPKENLGNLKSYFSYPLIISFLFLIHLNLLGFFMYTIPPTTHIILTFGFALVVWLGIILLGLISFKGDQPSTLMPTGAPLILSPFLILVEVAGQTQGLIYYGS
jgi:F0F1-type ATP synthase membrane subunit a